MITGFNTDIEHDGVTYHVQTEDKGLETPLILSLVYSGGAILASKRSRYDDLVAGGFDEKNLSERLQRQHKLICAAIHAGRIDELKTMSQREAGVRAAQKAELKEEPPLVQSEPPLAPIQPPVSADELPVSPARQSAPVINNPEMLAAAEPLAPVVQYTPPKPAPAPPVAMRKSQAPIVMRPLPAGNLELTGRGDDEEELNLELVEDRDFHASDTVALRIRVSRGAGGEAEIVPNAPVTVKVLGTTFRPLICTAMTDRDGIAVVFTTLPHFTSGRAAILIRVAVGGEDAEMRRIILPSQQR